jgi:hypothetical protein
VDQPYSTDGNALASSLICAALLEKLVAKSILTRAEVADLLRNARTGLGSGEARPAGHLDAARLIDDVTDRYITQRI